MNAREFKIYYLFTAICLIISVIYLSLLFSDVYTPHIGSAHHVTARIDATVNGERVEYVETSC